MRSPSIRAHKENSECLKNFIGTTPRLATSASSPSVTVTEAMVNAYAELTGDFTPVHVDEE